MALPCTPVAGSPVSVLGSCHREAAGTPAHTIALCWPSGSTKREEVPILRPGSHGVGEAGRPGRACGQRSGSSSLG